MRSRSSLLVRTGPPILALAICFVLWLAWLPIVVFADFRITNDDLESTEPGVAVGPDHLARIVWAGQVGGIYQIHWACVDANGNLVAGPIQITSGTNNCHLPQVSVDGANCSYVVCAQAYGASARVCWVRLGLTGTIETGPILLNTGSGECKRPDIATASDGTSHIAFEWWGAGLFHVKYVVLNSSGQVVRSKAPGDFDIFGAEKYPYITLEPGGNIDIVWNDEDNFTYGLYMARYTPGGTLLSRDRIKSGNSIAWPTIAAPLDGRVQVLYQQPNSGLDRIWSWPGSDPAEIVSPAPGPCRRPRVVGADNHPVYAVWEDWATGTSRVMAGEWSVDRTYLNNQLLISDGPAAATLPDIATDRQGQYYVVWRDARYGSGEIYMDAVKSHTIIVKAEVRPEHGDDAFLIPPPPLPGVTVRANADGTSWDAVTDALGMATFAVDVPILTYELYLTGPYFHVNAEFQYPTPDMKPVTTVVTPDPGATLTSFVWPSGTAINQGPALQAAYYIEKFRNDYWQDTMALTWTLHSALKPGEANHVVATIIDNHSVGPLACLYFMTFPQHRSDEADIVYHEFTHCVTWDRCKHANLPPPASCNDYWLGDSRESGSMEEALADYFAASYTNDAVIAECYTKAGPVCLLLRNMSFHRQYPTDGFGYEVHDGSLILSSALWDLRDRLDPGAGAGGAPVTDALVLAALDHLVHTSPGSGGYTFADFYAALVAVDQERHGGVHAPDITTAFGASNLGPAPQPFSPVRWALNDAIVSLDELGAGTIRMAWRPVENATYNVRMRLREWGLGSLGLEDGWVTIAEGVSDTSYVFPYRTDTSDYLFGVTPVDLSGRPGYPCDPVYVPALTPTAVPSDEQTPPSRSAGRWLYCSPNPFNPVTKLIFEVAHEGSVALRICDARGRRIRDWPGSVYPAGRHSVLWNGTDSSGRPMPSGTYLIEVRGANWRAMGKIVLLK